MCKREGDAESAPILGSTSPSERQALRFTFLSYYSWGGEGKDQADFSCLSNQDRDFPLKRNRVRLSHKIYL